MPPNPVPWGRRTARAVVSGTTTEQNDLAKETDVVHLSRRAFRSTLGSMSTNNKHALHRYDS